jgi:hypothetical protein
VQWWKNSGLKSIWSKDAMDLASEEGQNQVLQWWKNNGLDYTSQKGHIRMVETKWVKNVNGQRILRVIYSENVIIYAK